jgi:tRNA(fMet)-specific endonuclease VapC
LEIRLEQIDPALIATTIITYEEQTQGWLSYVARARTVVQQVAAYQRLSRHLDLYRRIRVLGFDEKAATQLQRLRQSRVRVGTMDLKIAAIVLTQGATLLSRNLKDFRRVPGPRVEDWTL